MMPRKGTTLGVLHGAGSGGQQWCNFIQKMFTVELPEEYRDMNLDVIAESVTNLGEDDVCNLNNCEYKMLLLDAEVLKILKDEHSTFRRCELMETQQEQVIVLNLGSEDDFSFSQEVRYNLSRLKDNEAYSVIQAKDPTQIFSDIMAVLAPMYVVPHPNILSCEDKDEHLTLISNKPYPTGPKLEYVIEFCLNGNTRQITASLFNPYTLLVPNPGHPPGLVTVKILICSHNPHTEDNVPEILRTQIGEDMKLWFQSNLDKVFSVLDSQTNPVSFLCQSMNISEKKDPDRTTVEMVDKLLTESFKKYVPDNKLSVVFGNAQHLDDDQDGFRTEYMPTLLHFSAMYGLRDLTAALLQCPGAVQAYGTANCDGDYPTDLAEKYMHWDLRDFMQTYMEVAAMVHDDYGERGDAETSQIMSCMVYGQYLSFAGDPSVPEDIYMPIGGEDMKNLSTPPGYLPMSAIKSASYNASLPQSVDYDFMIKRMLESADGPEEAYQTVEFPNLTCPPTVAPRRPSVSVVDPTPPSLPPRKDNKPTKGGLDPQDSLLILPKNTATLSPAQEELICLQKKVKDGDITINQAVFRFKEWERKHKEREASFQFQQENLMRFRVSLMKSRDEKIKRGDASSLKISQPLVTGSSTYDQVLLKTRHAVMVENAYGGLDNKKNEKRSGSERNFTVRSNFSGEETHFRNRTSFKESRSGRPPAPLPNCPGDNFTRFRGSLNSQGSSIRSHSSSGSGVSASAIDPPFLPPRTPMVATRFVPSGSISEEPPPAPFNRSALLSWSSQQEPAPPVPPRDERLSKASEPRPGVPPRNTYRKW